ncbi:MAG TPA: hypothetical protein VKS78_08815 [Roseiarcus sp.]|nr:hypothetical protein [Roseiarcus sp.]
MADIVRKLDQRFFSRWWNKASDRQREFLKVIAAIPNDSEEFGVQDIVAASKKSLGNPFTDSSARMMLKTLIEAGFVFRNRRGKYSFTVPMLDSFIHRLSPQAAVTDVSRSPAPPARKTGSFDGTVGKTARSMP